MAGRNLVCLALVNVCLCRPVAAETDTGVVEEPVVTGPDIPIKQSYVVPAVEIVLGNLVLSLTSYAAGADWGVRDSDEWFSRIVTSPWELDDDAYTTNQLAHPYFGTLSFNAARSTGNNFWVSGIYSFAGSILWENVLENEVPSFNDMMTTPIGGMFLGEAMHRFGRALLYTPNNKPGLVRRTASLLMDPVATINRAWWGDAWANTPPPSLFAYLAVGVQQPTLVYANRDSNTQVHLETYVDYGMLADPSFKARRPFDHFVLQGNLNISSDNTEADVYVRGVLLGSSWRNDVRAIYGLWGGYDYNNNDYVRASILGFGPGATAELELGERSYVAATLIAYLVPYGAAGGVREVEGPMRDSHDGPGLAQLGEIRFGQRGLFGVRFTTRAAQIAGRMVNDLANEYVIQTTLATRFQITPNHAIGIEAEHNWEHATFDAPNVMSPSNRTTDFRIFYALTTNEIIGR